MMCLIVAMSKVLLTDHQSKVTILAIWNSFQTRSFENFVNFGDQTFCNEKKIQVTKSINSSTQKDIGVFFNYLNDYKQATLTSEYELEYILDKKKTKRKAEL